MSKFLLKIELPDEKSCEGCPCLPDDEWRCLVEGEYISDGSGVPANGFPRPEWCPLEKHDAEEAIARIDALQKENARLRALVSRGAGMTATVPEMGHNAYAAECAAECEKWGKQ